MLTELFSIYVSSGLRKKNVKTRSAIKNFPRLTLVFIVLQDWNIHYEMSYKHMIRKEVLSYLIYCFSAWSNLSGQLTLSTWICKFKFCRQCADYISNAETNSGIKGSNSGTPWIGTCNVRETYKMHNKILTSVSKQGKRRIKILVFVEHKTIVWNWQAC